VALYIASSTESFQNILLNKYFQKQKAEKRIFTSVKTTMRFGVSFASCYRHI